MIRMAFAKFGGWLDVSFPGDAVLEISDPAFLARPMDRPGRLGAFGRCNLHSAVQGHESRGMVIR